MRNFQLVYVQSIFNRTGRASAMSLTVANLTLSSAELRPFQFRLEQYAPQLNLCLLKWCYIPEQVSTKSAPYGYAKLRLLTFCVATGAKLFAFSSNVQRYSKLRHVSHTGPIHFR
jgi:hypothetical protein